MKVIHILSPHRRMKFIATKDTSQAIENFSLSSLPSYDSLKWPVWEIDHFMRQILLLKLYTHIWYLDGNPSRRWEWSPCFTNRSGQLKVRPRFESSFHIQRERKRDGTSGSEIICVCPYSPLWRARQARSILVLLTVYVGICEFKAAEKACELLGETENWTVMA